MSTYVIKTIPCNCHTAMTHQIAVEVDNRPSFCEHYLDPEIDTAVQQAMYGKILSPNRGQTKL